MPITRSNAALRIAQLALIAVALNVAPSFAAHAIQIGGSAMRAAVGW